MSAPVDHITIPHGSMTLSIPKDIFEGPDARPNEKKEREFRELMKSRYPWLNDNSLDIIMKNARKEMLRIMDEESGGRSTSRRYASQGKYELAIEHLRQHLDDNPNDADGWYALGELLCKVGRTEEGYRAMNKGRSLI